MILAGGRVLRRRSGRGQIAAAGSVFLPFQGNFMSFKKICGFIIFVPLAVVMAAFIIANRHFVALNLDIFGRIDGGYSLTAPLFVWLFAFLALGFAAGALTMLPGLYKMRKSRHRLEADNNRLHKDLAAQKPQHDAASLDDIHL